MLCSFVVGYQQLCSYISHVIAFVFSCTFQLPSSYTLPHKRALLNMSGPLAYSTAQILILCFMYPYHFSWTWRQLVFFHQTAQCLVPGNSNCGTTVGTSGLRSRSFTSETRGSSFMQNFGKCHVDCLYIVSATQKSDFSVSNIGNSAFHFYFVPFTKYSWQ
jgi:hypothetical protein